jgi:hypothetical protein
VEIKLKHYGLYMRRLRAFARAQGYKIEYRDQDECGWHISQSRTIAIKDNMEQSEEIAVLLHELGHMEDDALKRLDPKEIKKIDRAYGAAEMKCATRRQVEIMIECETRAWQHGKAIASRLKIPLGKWFDREMEEAIDLYR